MTLHNCFSFAFCKRYERLFFYQPLVMVRWVVNCGGWLPHSHEWCAAMAAVQAEERERINKFFFQRDAKLALVGRLLLRAAVVEWEGVGNNEVEFGRTDKAKPILLRPKSQKSSLELNISHQGMYVVLATEIGRAVGVDMMELSRSRGQNIQEFFHTMRRQFTPSEWRHIRSSSSDTGQLASFYRLWCLKESFIKAEGSGLSYGLQRLDFIPHQPWPPALGSCCVGSKLMIDGREADDWQFQESLIDHQHCVAVAVKCPEGQPGSLPTFTKRSVSELLCQLTPLTSPDPAHWTVFSGKAAHPTIV